MNRCRMCNQIIVQDGTEAADCTTLCEECDAERESYEPEEDDF